MMARKCRRVTSGDLEVCTSLLFVTSDIQDDRISISMALDPEERLTSGTSAQPLTTAATDDRHRRCSVRGADCCAARGGFFAAAPLGGVSSTVSSKSFGRWTFDSK